MKRIDYRWLPLSSLFALFGLCSEVQAQSVVLAEPAAAQASLVRNQFAMGQSLVNPKTTSIDSLDELINLAAGRPSQKAFLKYGGDIERYWQEIARSRAGKTFEAILANRVNERLTALGSEQRLISTAIEGSPSHAADLLLLGENGEVLAHFQAKLGWSAAIKALNQSKYAGMSIVTTQDSLDIIKRELLKAEIKAARRGLPLGSDWELARDALRTGRLAQELPGGVSLPREAKIFYDAKRTLKMPWAGLGSVTAGEAQAASAAIGLGEIAGGALIVLDVGTTGFLACQDFQRFNESEIGTGDYAIKGGLRAANLYLLYITVADPEPFTKAGAAVALVVLIAVDVGHDWVIDSRNASARQLLESIDREERKQAVRGHLLNRVLELGA